MEMHQVRYFLALSETLNFTEAALRCNVSQPALTRAIQTLEVELGGELLRRERKLSHLTELGERMLPLMRQCYESALAIRTAAQSIRKGEAFYGEVDILGKPYITGYKPIRDSSKKVIGIYYVGYLK